MDPLIDISVIVPVVERFDDVAELYALYKKGLEDTGKPYEFIYVLDGDFGEVMEALKRLIAEGEKIKVIKLARWFGEATALTIGIQHSTGNVILTLPAYQQVEANEIPRLVESLNDCDMVIARRWPRKDSLLNRIQSRVFHMFLNPVSEFKFHDIGCGVRVFRKRVARGSQNLRRPAPVPADPGAQVRLPGSRSRCGAIAKGHHAAGLFSWDVLATDAGHFFDLLPGEVHQETASVLRNPRFLHVRRRVSHTSLPSVYQSCFKVSRWPTARSCWWEPSWSSSACRSSRSDCSRRSSYSRTRKTSRNTRSNRSSTDLFLTVPSPVPHVISFRASAPERQPGYIAIYLTVDVEEYYHAEVFSGIIDRAEQERYPAHVEKNTRGLLQLFQDCEVRGTFFILGSVAEKYPGLIRSIHEAGHEIASHGSGHRMITRMTPSEFREDVRKSRRILEDITGKAVLGYRAPTFSIVKRTEWAYEILRDEGFRYSSSVFPIRHDRYGWAAFGLSPRKMAVRDDRWIWEVPLSVERIGGVNLPFGGGGYLRLYPMSLTKYFFRRFLRNDRPAVVYVHPWEIDREHPRVAMPVLKRIRHYVGISGMEDKIRDLLRSFPFERMDEFLKWASSGREQGFPA